jgi:hypothetical protein
MKKSMILFKPLRLYVVLKVVVSFNILGLYLGAAGFKNRPRYQLF